MKPSVLHLTKYYPPYFGGVEVFTKLLAEESVKNGYETEVLSYSLDSKTSVELINGVKVFRAGVLFTLFSQPVSFTYIKRFFKTYKKFDTLHFHSLNPLIEFFSLFTSHKNKRVVTFHHDFFKPGLMGFFLGISYIPFLKLFLSQANTICTSSKFNETLFPNLKKFKEKCKTIPFGIKNPEKIITETNPNPHSINKKNNYLLFVGRLVKYKNLQTLLKAMLQVESTLLIIGSGPEEKNLKHFCSNLGLKDKVKFISKIDSDKDLYAYFKKAQAFILPSYSYGETFGIVLLEAMALGLPLITSNNIPSIAELNAHEVTGLQYEAGNEKDLADKINILLNDEKKRIQYGNNGREKYFANYSPEKMSSSYFEIYNKL